MTILDIKKEIHENELLKDTRSKEQIKNYSCRYKM